MEQSKVYLVSWIHVDEALTHTLVALSLMIFFFYFFKMYFISIQNTFHRKCKTKK